MKRKDTKPHSIPVPFTHFRNTRFHQSRNWGSLHFHIGATLWKHKLSLNFPFLSTPSAVHMHAPHQLCNPQTHKGNKQTKNEIPPPHKKKNHIFQRKTKLGMKMTRETESGSRERCMVTYIPGWRVLLKTSRLVSKVVLVCEESMKGSWERERDRKQ